MRADEGGLAYEEHAGGDPEDGDDGGAGRVRVLRRGCDVAGWGRHEGEEGLISGI